MPPFIICVVTNRIAHFVEVLLIFYLAQRVKLTETCTNIYFEKAIILSKQIGKSWGIDMKKIALILGSVG